jgi:hypothetical protein
MDLEAVYTELNIQLEQMNRRLELIAEKLDAQAERDHLHELKIQKLEISFDILKNEFTETKGAIRSIKENTDNEFGIIGKKIKDIENRPDKKKAGLVDSLLEKTFSYLIGIILAAIVAYLTVVFGQK